MRGGISRNLHGGASRALRSQTSLPKRQRLRESPRGPSREGNGQGFGPGCDPTGRRRASAWKRSGKALGFRPELFPRGDRRGFPPRCEPWNRPGFGQAGSARGAAAGPRSCSSDPTGIGERLIQASPETHRGPNGASRPRCGIRGDRQGVRARCDPEAAQREMASPPSDGSQSWDKWGPAATPAPIMIPRRFIRAARVGLP